ncbi:MAG: DUF4293 domain-containing protein [Prevotella sp.]|nr:DUF4293 domain-containing protein [Prevotella sp.]
MWQRKQTVFLVCALIFTAVCLSLPLLDVEPKGMGVSAVLYNLIYIDGDGVAHYGKALLFAFLLLTCPLNLFAIFMFKNRKLQASLCTWCMILNLAWYVYLAFCVINEFMLAGTPHFHIAVCFPLIAIVFYYMARRGIMADEKLVRSMDRIR